MRIKNLNIKMVLWALAIGTVAVITLCLPTSDHESYSYELNQPWKYPLLTAAFDIPIVRDSVSSRQMRDSIDKFFVPFVKRNNGIEKQNVERFSRALSAVGTQRERAVMTAALQKVYEQGIMDGSIYDSMRDAGSWALREADESGEGNSARSVDATHMRTPAMAYEYVDSIIRGMSTAGADTLARSPLVTKALANCITPNVLLDTVTDLKFRNQEYLNVTGALGVIKKGQRIVDRGEIVTAQVMTNLDTYTAMLKRQEEQPDTFNYFVFGQVLYISLMVGILYCFMLIYRKRFVSDIRKMVFLMSFITAFVIFSVLTFENFANGIYLVPFAAVPVVILIFFDSRTAIFSLITVVMISALVATFPFQFIMTELCVGLVATFSIQQLSRRSQLLRTAIISFLMYCLCYFISELITNGNLSGFSPKIIGTFGINAVILSFAYILIVIVEKVFGFTSSVTLVELSDINSPLLRRLAEEAPGTFQHSMQVSALAAEAARAIGANSLLVRTGALYHDIGKLESPVFFTENQHGINPHAGLDPETSAKKIISHVTEGLSLAGKNKLPKRIKDFIQEHHGRGVTRYFYTTAVNNAPEGTEVDKNAFMYPGPNPQSKETAVLMMADAVEAASRSLRDYSPKSIDALVDKIVGQQQEDGLFDESPLSFHELQVVKDTFKKRLATIYHSRVAYPEMRKEEQGGK